MAKDSEVTARIDQIAREITDREWLEIGVTQEEMDQTRLEVQQMNAALGQGYSMDEVLAMFDCAHAEDDSEPDKPVAALITADSGAKQSL